MPSQQPFALVVAFPGIGLKYENPTGGQQLIDAAKQEEYAPVPPRQVHPLCELEGKDHGVGPWLVG